MSINTNSVVRKSSAFFLMMMYFILTFRVFDFLPLGFIEEAVTIIFILILLSFYILEIYHGFTEKKIAQFHFIILPVLLIPFVNCIQANMVYGQPWYYGFLAQRTNFLILVISFTVLMLKKKWLSIRSLELSFFIAANLCLLFFLYYYLFVDPLQYVDTDLVIYSSTRGYRFKFPNVIVNSLLFYCVFQIWINKNRKYYFSLFAVLIYIVVFLKDRSQIVAIAFTLLFYYMKNLNMNQRVFYAGTSIVSLMFLFFILYFLYPDLINTYIQLYTNASTIITGESAGDYSINLRLIESKIAIDGFIEHPLMGTGFVSAQWNSGYLGIYKYFYPSDVGILGNLFVFGILGTLIYYLLFLFSFIYSIPLTKNFNVFLVSAQYTMIFLFLDMFTVASNIKYIGMIAFFVSIIYYFRFYHVKEYSD